MSVQLPPGILSALSTTLEKDGLKLESHVASPGCNAGDNYLGEVLRVRAYARDVTTNQIEERKYIFKRPPQSKKWREEIKSIKLTTNEYVFYMEILPVMESFIKGKLPVYSIPKFYYGHCQDDENDLLILQDLQPLGYKMADRVKCLDLDHCSLVLQELGRFHATSLAMKILEPGKFEQIKTLAKEVFYFEEGRPQFSTIHLPCNSAMRMLKQKYPDDTKYMEKFEKLMTNCFDHLIHVVSTETPLSVINHGDCWTNNFLFLYDHQNRPIKLQWIDFQMVRYSSVALDLSYFLYNCTTQATRDQLWEEMMTIYLAELNESLSLMGLASAQVSRSKLDEDMSKFARYGVISATCFCLPLFTKSKDETMISVQDEDTGIEQFDNLHEKPADPLCILRVTDVIVDAFNRGYLD